MYFHNSDLSSLTLLKAYAENLSVHRYFSDLSTLPPPNIFEQIVQNEWKYKFCMRLKYLYPVILYLKIADSIRLILFI